MSHPISQDPGIEELRRLVAWANGQPEAIVLGPPLSALVRLYNADQGSEWQVPLGRWEAHQIEAALAQGTPPRWTEGEHGLKAVRI